MKTRQILLLIVLTIALSTPLIAGPPGECGIATVTRGSWTPPPADAGRPGPRVWVERAVPAGALFDLELATELSTRHARVGDPVRARLLGDVWSDSGDLVLRDGAEVVGHVEAFQRPKRMGGQAWIAVRLVQARGVDGDWVPWNSVWTFGIRTGARDADTVANAAATGAVIGDIIDYKDGGWIGGLIGAAAGAIWAAERNDDLYVPGGVVDTLELSETSVIVVPWRPR